MTERDFVAYLAGLLLYAKLSGKGLTDIEVSNLLDKLLTVKGAPDIDSGDSPNWMHGHPSARC